MCCELNLAGSWELLCCLCRGPRLCSPALCSWLGTSGQQFFFFLWCWGLSPGPCAGEAGTLPTELHPQLLASGFCSSCFIPSGAPPVFPTCSTEWLLHVHFWPPQGTPVSAWRPVSRTPGPGPTWCHLHEENGEEAGRGEPSCVFSFYLFTF